MDFGREIDVDEPVACLSMGRLVAPLQLVAQPSLNLPRCLGHWDRNSWMLGLASVMPLEADSFGDGFG